MAVEYTIYSAISLDPTNFEYAIGSLLGVVLHPDLDVNHGRTHSTRYIRKLGLVPSLGWTVVWYPYRKSIKHGSHLSHLPVLGTVGRLVYLFLFAVAIPYLVIAPVLHLNLQQELEWWFRQPFIHYKLVLGLMSADFIHWVLDVSTREHRKKVSYGNN
jgi:uncharacterized metal-binding protein